MVGGASALGGGIGCARCEDDACDAGEAGDSGDASGAWCSAGVLLLGFTGSAASRDGRSRSDARRAAPLATPPAPTIHCTEFNLITAS